MHLGERAAAGSIRVVVIDLRAQRRLARADDAGDGARQVVAPDRMRRDHGAHVAREVTGAMRRRDASQRACGGEVNETEISKAGEGRSEDAVDGPAP